MEKGKKIIYTNSFPNFEFGVGYYLFPIAEDPIYDHLVTINQDLLYKITDPVTFVFMHKNGTLPFGEVKYVADAHIRPFSEKLERALRKNYSFVEARLNEYKLYFPKYWEVFKKLEQFELSFTRLVFVYYIAKLRFLLQRFFNKVIYPVLGIFLFDFWLIFQLHAEYRKASNDLKNKKRRLENRNPLIPTSEEELRKEKVEIQELSQKLETVRSNLLRSNRAIIAIVLAIITFLGTQYFAKKTELLLNDRINIIQREKQSIKESENDMRQQITRMQNEKETLLKTIEDLKKGRR